MKIKILVVILFAAVIVLGQMAFTKKAKKGFSVRIPIQERVFQEKISRPPPEWMVQSIRQDLAPFSKDGVTREMLDQLFRGERIAQFKLVRFMINNGAISVAFHDELIDKRYFRHLLAAFEKLASLVRLPDVDFVVSLADGFYENPDFPHCPCFVFSKTEKLAPFVLIPDFKAMTGYPSLQKEIAEGSRKYPWHKKHSLAFWRGTTSGGHLTKERWEQFARPKLALLSLLHPQYLDAKITTVTQADPGVEKIVAARGLVGGRVSQKEHLQYKYLVDVDGNACTFERYFWTLLSNSVVLKQITPNRQWYYGGLEPYRHYIPVKDDLSDLMEKINWAQEHDDEAKEIAEEATQFVKNNLMIEDTYLYLYQLLLHYSDL